MTLAFPEPTAYILIMFQDLCSIGRKFLKIQYLFLPLILLIIGTFLLWNNKHKLFQLLFRNSTLVRENYVLTERVTSLENELILVRREITQLSSAVINMQQAEPMNDKLDPEALSISSGSLHSCENLANE